MENTTPLIQTKSVCERFITTTAHWNAVMMIKFVINSNCAQPKMNACKRVRKRLHHHWHLVCRHTIHHSNAHRHHKHKMIIFYEIYSVFSQDLCIKNTLNSTEMSSKTCGVVRIFVKLNRGGQSFCDYTLSMLSIACSAL